MIGMETKITIEPGGKGGKMALWLVRSGKIPLLLAVSITDVPSFEISPPKRGLLVSKVLNVGDKGDSLL